METFEEEVLAMEDIFSMDLKHLPPESAADDKGKIMVYGRQLGWRTVDIREADHFCKFFQCTHFTYTPPIPTNDKKTSLKRPTTGAL